MITRTFSQQKTIRNPLKRTDVFRCAHAAHKDFDFSVSVYHVLKEKQCFPDGCMDFKWHCRSLKRNKKCHRGYTNPGKKCDGCNELIEEKIQRTPKIMVSEKKYMEFTEQLVDFQNFLDSVKGKKVIINGLLSSVKPMIVGNGTPEGRKITGFLLTLKEGFIGFDRIEDTLYARIGAEQQQLNKFRPGDKVEFKGYIFIDRGRMVLKKISAVTVFERGDGYIWETAKARVAAQSGIFLENKPRKCRRCPMGLLVDGDNSGCSNGRRIFCMQGIENPEECVFDIYDKYFSNSE